MSKTQLLLRIFVIVAIVEAGIMLVLDVVVDAVSNLPRDSLVVHAVADVVMLTLICVPLIYYFAIMPFEEERDRARAQLQGQIQNFEEAQRIGHVGSWRLFRDLETVEFSKEALRLLELDPNRSAWSFQEFVERVHGDDRELFEKAHDRIVSGDASTITYRLKTRDGNVRWVRERLRLCEEEEVFCQGTILDISEAKEAEEARSRFVSAITHELRTPLTAIKGSFGLMASIEEGKLSAKAARLVDVGQNAAERLLRLIDELLDLDKIHAGRLDLHAEITDMSALLSSAVEANQAFAESFGVRLEVRDSTSGASIFADPDRITQVITNLLSNAIKASGPGDRVCIELDNDDDTVRTTVSDNGAGIPAELQPRLFQDFAHSSDSYRANIAGTGLGLSISKEIVEAHGGTIGFSSTEGEGASFFFSLPSEA
ncbi:MAG: PAS domain-containing protein [Rhodobacteraceae bacterium]|nr:PAS domain-containing protein [Paracoccaceae bacterium]